MVKHWVVPPGWAARHRPVVEGFFADTIRLERVTGYTVDATRTHVKAWTALYEGPGLIEEGVAGQADTAGVQRDIGTYTGRYPTHVHGEPTPLPQPGDRVVCVASDDPRMPGREFAVTHAETQGHVVDRQFTLSASEGVVA